MAPNTEIPASLLLLSPVTLSWSPLYALYYLKLSIDISSQRKKTQTSIGSEPRVTSIANTSGSSIAKHKKTDSSADDYPTNPAVTSTPTPSAESQSPSQASGINPLSIAVRSHANFGEYVPISLFLIFLNEVNGGEKWILNGMLGGLFVARVLHVEFGLKGKKAVGWGRSIGAAVTYFMLAFSAGYNFKLALPYIKASLLG